MQKIYSVTLTLIYLTSSYVKAFVVPTQEILRTQYLRNAVQTPRPVGLKTRQQMTNHVEKAVPTRKQTTYLMLTSDLVEDFSSGSMLVSHTHQLLGIDTGLPLLNQVLINPSFWSICVMLTIVSLLYTWEEIIHTLRHNLPKPLLPVLESLLGEIAGLGFIGLVLEVFITSNPERGIGNIISNLSNQFLGEDELLIEVFEFLHDAFFQVGVGFFLIMGSIVYLVLKRISELSQISDLAIDTDGDGDVTLEELATALNVPVTIVDADGDGHLTEEEITNALRNTVSRNFVQELFLTQEERAAEKLVIRENFIMNNNLSDDFLIERYFEFIYAHQLEEMVELSPVVWLPLIPIIALLNAVDLSREIVSASSDNAALSSGCFITASWFMVPLVLSQVLCLSWGMFNFWKMKKIKNMLIPTLVRDGINGEATLLPPRYLEKELRMELNTSPGPIAFIERALGGKPCTNDHECLFGAAGQEGPEIYKKSIKYHTWACVSSLIFIFNEIVLRDFFTWLDYSKGLITVDDIGDITWVVPEFQLFSVFAILSVLQLAVSPIAFLNYSTAVSVEKMMQPWALEKAKEASRKESKIDFTIERDINQTISI